MEHFHVLWIVLVLNILPIKNGHGLFRVGRISEGQFEYSALNGWMTPGEGKDLCDKDPQCGGFTYKGSSMMDREFDMYFFLMAMNVETDMSSWKWMYYTPNHTYITFPGIFEGGEEIQNMKFHNPCVEQSNPETRCDMESDCVAIIKTDNTSTTVLVDFLDMDSFKVSKDKTTLVKLRNVTKDTKIEASSPWDDIDICCPKHKKINTKQIMRKVNDTMPRISCDISQNEFFRKYVRKREPVILVNCTKEWIAQREWTMEKLLNENEGRLMWRSDFETERRQFQRFKKKTTVSGNFLKTIVRINGTFRVFDELGRKKHTAGRRNGAQLETDKTYLFSQYSKPAPIPTDYYEKAGILTNFQWLIMSQKDTGTELHMDPDYTSPWNTVLSGYKWWVLMSPEVLPDAFLCDKDCSKMDADEDDINNEAWFSHVLPQLRGRKWYGSTVREFIQGPGETIYMPGNLAHAIMNIEENISVTENYFLEDSLEDWVHGMMTGEMLMDDDSDGLDEEIFWKAMYFRYLKAENRKAVRAMMNQVEYMSNNNVGLCDDEDEDNADFVKDGEEEEEVEEEEEEEEQEEWDGDEEEEENDDLYDEDGDD